MLRLAQGNEVAAWAAFAPVWQEAVIDDTLGTMHVEPAERLAQLLAVMPTAQRQHKATQTLLQRLASWKQAPVSARALARETADMLAQLTQREREVLARIAAGDSNKLIARTLDLSPHTVKRHVANILDKLNVPTRSAAAAVYRQQQ
jgi:LuxR family maltose regulon positive regulatory protein